MCILCIYIYKVQYITAHVTRSISVISNTKVIVRVSVGLHRYAQINSLYLLYVGENCQRLSCRGQKQPYSKIKHILQHCDLNYRNPR